MKSKKIANPEYKEIKQHLATAEQTSARRSLRIKNAMKPVNEINKESESLRSAVEKKSEKLQELIDAADLALVEFIKTTDVIKMLIEQLKSTPKTIEEES